MLVPLGNQRKSKQRKSKQRKSKQRKSSLRSGAGGADTLSSAGVWGSSWCCSSSSALFGHWVAVVEVKSRLRVAVEERWPTSLNKTLPRKSKLNNPLGKDSNNASRNQSPNQRLSHRGPGTGPLR